MTYGTSFAPYLATRCLQELSKAGKITHPQAAKVLAANFYIDDLLTSESSIPEGRQLCSQLQELLQSAGFCLRKWSSNCPLILQDLSPDLLDERTLLDLESSSAPIKTLGLQWQTTTDQLLFSVPKWSETAPITKRVVLSDASKLFDPLGLVGPVIVQAKIYLQELWRIQKSWDEPLEHDLQTKWREFKHSLEALRNIHIPRWVIPMQAPNCIHGARIL